MNAKQQHLESPDEGSPIRILFLSTFALIFSATPAMTAETLTPKHVLLLNSYNPSFVWSQNLTEAFLDEFRKAENVELHVEYMDSKRHQSPEYFEQLATLYASKYKNMKFDVVVCADDNALNFALDRRAKLFGDSPIVFCGINHFTDERIAGQKDITGVVEKVDYQSTLDIIKSFHPSRKTILLLSEGLTTGRENKRAIQPLVDANRDEFDFRFIAADIETLQASFDNAPEDSVVWINGLIRTQDGQVFIAWNDIGEIARNCPFPVYSSWDFLLSPGTVGGNAVSSDVQGRRAAEQALEILNGKDADEIPIIRESPNVNMFHYPELVRFGVSMDQVPPGSIILNQPAPSFYAQHKGLVWAIVIFVIVQSMMIFLLLINWRLRRRAMKELRRSEKRVCELFEGIDDALVVHDESGTIIDFNNAACRRLEYTANELMGMSITDIDDEHSKSHIQGRFDLSHLGTSISFESLYRTKSGKEIPVDLNATMIEYRGKQAVLCVCRDITERKQAEQSLQQHLRFIDTLVDTIPNPIFFKDGNGYFLGCNKPFAHTIVGSTRQEIIGKPLPDLKINLSDKDVESFQQQDRELIATPGTRHYEESVICADGQKRDFIVSKSTFFDADGNPGGIVGIMMDITERNQVERERNKLIDELKQALKEVKTLSGLLPICASCKKVRDDKGYWEQIEVYLAAHSDAQFSHGLCPQCIKMLYPDLAEKIENENQ